MRDFGYDVADYQDVDPVFGTLADLDRLIAAAHALGIRVLLDYVPNHTSSDHLWFREARSSQESPLRDWYIWRDAAPSGGPPNALRSQFKGPAWTLDQATGQYWFHTFLPEQPELDWRNPDVREAMLDVLRFWFERGIDGVRIDVLWLIAKDDWPWRPDPVRPGPGGLGGDPLEAIEHGDGPTMGERLAELRAVADGYPERVLIGEVYMPAERLVRYYGEDGRGVHLPFNFALATLPWDAATVSGAVAAYEAALPAGAWPTWVLGNHDQPRIATRVGRDQARVAAMLLLTLRGTPTLYYGDELGLEDVPVPIERIVDVAGRDPERAPMPWNRSMPHAGFSAVEPWLPLPPDASGRSVEAQCANRASILWLHRRLLDLRRSEPALAVGAWRPLMPPHGIVGYDRSLGEVTLRVLLNLTDTGIELDLDGSWRVRLSTLLDRADDVSGSIALRADEGVILERLA